MFKYCVYRIKGTPPVIQEKSRPDDRPEKNAAFRAADMARFESKRKRREKFFLPLIFRQN